MAFENVGAYCASEGIALFLSRELPAIILLRDRHDPILVRKPFPTEMLNIPMDEMR